MPKTTMDEDNLLLPCEYDIGASWQIVLVERVSIAQSMDHASDSEFRRSICRTYQPHSLASLLLREIVSHLVAMLGQLL